MKTSIIISGSGISSKSIIYRAIDKSNTIGKVDCFKLNFKTKGDATKALSTAYQYLKSDKEDWNKSNASYLKGHSLYYDAGTAKIFPTN